MAYETILFDFDGVLANSRPPHEQFAYDMAKKHGIKFEGFEVLISPMEALLLQNGFPQRIISEVIGEYETSFSERYKVQLFEGIAEMLGLLKSKDRVLKLASSNRQVNVLGGLGDLVKLFSDIWTIDMPGSKMEALRRMATRNPVFIGDTVGDFDLARKVSVPFIGAGFGWDGKTLKEKEEEFGIYTPMSVDELSHYLVTGYRKIK